MVLPLVIVMKRIYERNQTIEDYFSTLRISLVLQLKDYCDGFMKNDFQIEGYLKNLNLSMEIIFIKTNKISGSKRKSTLNRYIKDNCKY